MEVVRLLLEANAKKDKVFDDGSAVLMAPEVFRLLSDADADKNIAGTGNEDIAPFFFFVWHCCTVKRKVALLLGSADEDHSRARNRSQDLPLVSRE